MPKASLKFQPFPNGRATSASQDYSLSRPARSNLSSSMTLAAMSLGYNSTQVNSIRTILQNRGFTVTV